MTIPNHRVTVCFRKKIRLSNQIQLKSNDFVILEEILRAIAKCILEYK